MPIINSLLDNDLYKFTMMQGVLHFFPDIEVLYEFKCRTENIDLSPFSDEIKREINHLCSLSFKKDELDYLKSLSFLKKDFIDFLKFFRLNPDHVKITVDNKELGIKIEGSWLLTILFEVPILAIVNQIYFSNNVPNPDFDGAMKLLEQKMHLVQKLGNKFKFADFGTRRRFSYSWQKQIINKLVNSPLNLVNFVGTSNISLAKQFSIKPIGTMAHEWLQAGQAVGVRLIDSQKFMLQKWVDEYRGDLGIALSDIVGIDAFLFDFDKYFSKLYDGVRHDSGDPFIVGEKIIQHYEAMKINPWTKSIVFSDGLDFNIARKILEHFQSRIQVSFGIGTNLTNDIPNQNPLQIVIKMVRCNGQPVAKISDSPEKGMCNDEEYLNYLKKVFSEKMKKSD
ncbi:nicotinate phosphoribosyltransferase [Candidatus Lokiarchaeum ossiferum]|uniref:nicotinate phosphoribosyltransferase n=1 Tax=Candidatus Lokiarchaeum ossiferum TaxID=2951803 RepID=UPI00352C7190